MAVYLHPDAATYGSGAHHVTVVGVTLTFCTCGGALPSYPCVHIADVTDHVAAWRLQEAHRHERDMVKWAIEVLPDVPRAA